MDTSYLERNHQKLLDFLIEKGYHRDALRLTKKVIRFTLTDGAKPSIKTYEQLFEYEVKKLGYKEPEGRYKSLKAYFGSVKRFDLYGKYPCGKGEKSGFYIKDSSYLKLNGYYQDAVSILVETASKSEYSEKSQSVRRNAFIQFCLHIQLCGANSFNEVSNTMVYSFFHNGINQIRGKDYCGLLRSSLKSIIKEYGLVIQEIINALPHIKRVYRNFDYLTMEESRKIRECLESDDSVLTHQERSVGWILYFYGLRGSDITNLKFNNIDWVHDRISIVQSKTNNPLTLPLNAAVGNSLYDYITHERPQNDSDTVLTCSSYPYNKLKYLRQIVVKIFKAAGIRTEKGAKGVRVMRHHLVTYLLSHGVECATVSSIVGHSSPESIKPYADADIEHLRACSLSISDYPINSKLLLV